MPTTCLIAEADPFIADLLLRFAEESMLNGTRVRTGQEMLISAQQINPDILIVDPELPGSLRGWEALRAVRSQIRLAHIPVITCSWLTQAEAHELTGDAVAHLQKPDLHYEDFTRALASTGVAQVTPPAAG